MKKQMTLAIVLSLSISHALAGQSCEESVPDVRSVRMAFASAVALQTQLEQHQPQVALLARVGQDLSKYQLRYSHMGFVTKDPQSGQWRVQHLLNRCATPEGDLWQEGLANFFMDTPHTYQYMLIVPSSSLQTRLLSRLNNPAFYRNAMFNPRYNMLAYPYSTRYANSNQWLLEIIASAAAEPIKIDSRQQAQQWLQLMQYQPTNLSLGAFTRLGARMFRANVAFDDHPTELRFSGMIHTVTVESVRQFVQKIDPQVQVMEEEEVKLQEPQPVVQQMML